VRYPFDLADYAKKLGGSGPDDQMSVRTLKRWIKLGKQKTPMDLPPLDEPGKLPAWWTRNCTQKVPDWMLRIPASESPPPPATTTGCGADALQEEDLGIGATLDRLQRAERDAGAAYFAELGRGEEADEIRADRLERKWNRLSDNLRKVEKDASRVLSGSGELVKKTDVELALRDINTNLAARFRTFFSTVFPKLEGAPREARNRLWDQEADRFLEGMTRHGLSS